MRAVIPLSIPFIVILATRPVLRRLAFRSATRRPRETVLVVIGSLLGTAILTGSFVVGDTLEASLRRLTHTQLGPVDEVVSNQSAGADAWNAARTRLATLKSRNVDGVLPMTVMSPVAVATTTEPRRASPRTQILEMDFAAARNFGGDARATGVTGATPTAGHAVAVIDLANKLRLKAGDPVDVYAYGRSIRVVVDRVVPRFGVAGYSTGLDGQSRNLFLHPGTISSLVSGLVPTGLARPQNVVAISNHGGVEDGARATTAVSREIVRAVGLPGVRVFEVKREALRQAKESGAQFTQLFSAMGMFGVIAGILLLVNIFVMLAEERRSELGMLRAVGMRRSSLVAAFSTEGWLYALSASAAGSIAGIGLGRVIVKAAAGVFRAGGFERGSLDLTFAAKASSIQRGFQTGFVIAIVTVVLTSVRISRFNVIQAIRDLNEPAAHRASRRGLALGALLLFVAGLMTISSFQRHNAFGGLLGPALMAVSLIPLLSRLGRRRLVTSGAFLIALLWGVIAIRFFRDSMGSDSGLMVFVAQGILLTGSAVALVSQNQDVIGAVLRRFGGGSRALALRLGLAYPLARRFRTGMTLAMYTLVIFTLTFITVFSHIISSQVQAFADGVGGGFDVIVFSNSTNPVPPESLAARPGSKVVAPIYSGFGEFTVPGHDTIAWPVSGFDTRLLEGGAPRLMDHGAYASDDAAYRAVASDPGLIIVSQFFGQRRQSSGPPRRLINLGDTMTLTNPATLAERSVKVAAIGSGGPGLASTGAMYGLENARSLFGDRLIPNTVFIKTQGVDPDRYASELTGAYFQNGVEANAITTLVSDVRSRELGFFGLIRGYLALGLLVGIAGLGVIMVRAVRERRRQIGVLRALGFDPSMVRRSFVIESGFVALEGVLIGVVLALITSYSLVASSDVFGGSLKWGVPVVSLIVVVLGTLAASLLATAAPSQAASRIRPAVALRIAD
jgi:putative ABC transport system permease protein